MIESKPLRLLRFISDKPWITFPLACLYIFCMFVYPWFGGSFVWSHVQDVWDRWQTLNAGVLAIAASFIALNITNFNENKKRERQFIAARAFLPEALNELCGYCKTSASVLVGALNRVESANRTAMEVPPPPEDYKAIFARCIEFAEAGFGNHLAKILADLQVHSARLDSLCGSRMYRRRAAYSREAIINLIYCLGEIQARINRSFDFARGEGEFDASPLTCEDVMNAYRNIDIHLLHDIAELEAFTTQRLNQ